MKAIVSGMVWLPRRELTPDQITFFRQRLTVTPKKFGGFGDDDVDPTPIKLYQETPVTFGLPRAWWFKNARGEYEYEWKVSEGSPIELESRIKHEGPYVEQAEVVEFLEQMFGEAMTGFFSDKERGEQLGGILRGKTGFGKTQVALELIKRLGRTALIVVHKELLMKQWVARIKKFLPNARVGIVREDRCEIEDVDIVIAMAQSLALDDGRGGRYPRELYSWPSILIVDECFIGSQQIATYRGGVPISDVKVGDVVNNVNGRGVVTDIHCREVPLSHMRVVRWDGGEAVCTDFHPFLTQRGWVVAAELTNLDHLLTSSGCIDTMLGHGQKSLEAEYLRLVRQERVCSEGASLLFQGMYGDVEAGGDAFLRGVQEGSDQAFSESFLFSILSAEMDGSLARHRPVEGGKIGVGKGTAQARSGAGGAGVQENDRKEPDEVGGDQGEDVQNSQEDGAQTSREGRERNRSYSAPKDAFRDTGRRCVGFRACSGDRGKEGEGGIAEPLQDRFGISGEDGRDRGGWNVAQRLEKEGIGPEKRRFPAFKRVVSISCAKRDDIERHQGDDGIRRTSQGDLVTVYNISVGGHPSYVLADSSPDRGDQGVVVHNCHRAGAPTWSPLPMRFTSAFRLGLTATPRRKDGADRVFWDHIGEVVFTAKTEMPRPHIRMFDVRAPMPPYATDPDTMQPVVINELSRSSQRSTAVFAEIAAALRAPVGRKIFVLSHRLAHLDALAKLLEKSDIEATYDFYVGEWFTGEVDPPLKEGKWLMDENGRKKAIQTIYTSISRRKSTPDQHFGGRVVKREFVDVEEGPFVEWGIDGWGNLKFERRHPILNGRKKPKTESIHVLEVSGDVINGLKGDFVHMESAAIDLVLEDLTDDELFRLARDFEIKQKSRAKKRPRTDDELYKAEEARVMFVTYQMTSEGIDVPPVDTIVLATPSSDVEQAIGRGRRFCVPVRHGGLMEPEDCAHFCPWRAETCEGKGRLVVSDVCDPDVPLAQKRESWRMFYYRSERFKVAGRS